MAGTWAAVAALRPKAASRSPSPQPKAHPRPQLRETTPRYTPMMLVGFPPRPHFEMVEEPDAETAIDNTNDWFILRDEDMSDEGFWTSSLKTRWIEKTSTVSTPTEINEIMYGLNQVSSETRNGHHDVDDGETGYLLDDDVGSKDVEHCHCDVDTMTGRLIPPLKHPRSFPAQIHELERFDPDRKNRCSQDIIIRKMTRKAKMSRTSTLENAYQDAILALEKKMREQPMKSAPGHLHPVSQSVIFRPAVLADMEVVTAIYNAEVLGAGMAPDSKAVPDTIFPTILRTCKANKKPFIVAVRDANELADPSKWPHKLAFDDRMRLKKAHEKIIGKGEEVVGFAYLGPSDYGIWATEGNAQFSARIRCFVDSKHRRNGIGRALVDLMLQMTVTGYKAKCDSDWRCEQPAQVFERVAMKNAKKYHRIFIEVYCGNKDDSSFEELRALLENQIGFTPMGRILGGYMTSRGEESVWLDKHIWGMDTGHEDELGWYTYNNVPGK